jgi:hypothetical protein
MAFNPNNITKLQPSTLFTQPATIPSVQPPSTTPQFWLYNATTDSSATVEANGYFNYFADWQNTLLYANGQNFQIGDVIYAVCSDVNVFLYITAIVPGINTQITSISSNIIQYIKVPISLTNFLNMYTTPVQLIAAPGAGSAIIIDQMTVNWIYGTAQLAGGGVVEAQYGNAAHGAGVAASGSITAGTFTGYTVSSSITVISSTAAMPNASIIATGVFLSNQSAVFTGGTGGSANVHIWYHTVTL